MIKKSAKAHRIGLEKGLRITINGTPLQTARFELLKSDVIKPGYSSAEFNGSKSALNVSLYVGIGDSGPKEAGWYVFCNGRMVLEADQTSRTIWGGELGEINIPKIHNQFSRFRGYAFFDSDDQKRLPWTSTKSGINLSSQEYREVRGMMMQLSRPVISFLNELDNEKDGESRPRQTAVEAAKRIPLSEIDQTPTPFTYYGDRAKGSDMARICFQRAKAEVERVKKNLDVSTNREVGEGVFDYFIRYEIGAK